MAPAHLNIMDWKGQWAEAKSTFNHQKALVVSSGALVGNELIQSLRK
jgi:hypothetical protein